MTKVTIKKTQAATASKEAKVTPVPKASKASNAPAAPAAPAAPDTPEVGTFTQIVYLDIDTILPYENNPRLNQEAVTGVRNSIKEFGFNVPIIVDSNMVIVTGHTRRLAAIELGLKSVPVIVASHLNEAQVAAFRLADNRLSENAKWDEGKLATELKYIQNMGFSLDMTGFTKAELDCLCGEVSADCLSDLTYEGVCGSIVEVSTKEALTVLISVGSYKLRVPMEVYLAWETMMLNKYGTSKEVVDFVREALMFTPAALNGMDVEVTNE